MVYAGFLIGLASAISVIITDGQIIHTIIYYISMPLVLLPKTLAAVFMFLVNLVFNFFVSSASGQAAIVMPLMVPMADILEIPETGCSSRLSVWRRLLQLHYPHLRRADGCVGCCARAV